MKKNIFLILILMLLVACQPEVDPFTQADMETAKTEIENAATAWWIAWSSVELEDGLSIVSSDEVATWIGDSKTLEGLEAMRGSWTPWAEDLIVQDFKFVFEKTIVLSPEFGYTIREYEVTALHADSTRSPVLTGIESLTWKKENGKWRVLMGHESTREASWLDRLEFDSSRTSEQAEM